VRVGRHRRPCDVTTEIGQLRAVSIPRPTSIAGFVDQGCDLKASNRRSDRSGVAAAVRGRHGFRVGFSEQAVKERFIEFGQGVASMSPALRDLVKERS